MKKSLFFISVLSCGFIFNAHTQSTFNLIGMNKMVLNPGFTASDTAFKHTASLTAQTLKSSNGFPGLITNNSIGTYQMRIDKIHSGIGIMINDNYFNIPSTTVNNQMAAKLYYRYTLFSCLSFGIDAGLVNENRYLTYTGLTFNGSTPVYFQYPPETVNNLVFDAGAGILYQSKGFYAGFSMDHINKPKASYPSYSPNGTVEGTSTSDLINFQGIEYDWVLGGSIPVGNCSIDLSASYYQLFRLNLNATFEAPHFFVGFSAIQENNSENHIFDEHDYYFYSAEAGIKVYKNKIRASFIYDFFPNSEPKAYSLAIIEGGLSYSF